MSQTSKLIRQRIQNKRERKQGKAQRLKLWLALTVLVGLLILLPTAFLLGSAGLVVFGQLQSIPDYSTAARDFQRQQIADPPTFFGRTATGETVALGLSEAGLVSEPAAWPEVQAISPNALNGVYAQWPDLLLNNDPAESETIFNRWSAILQNGVSEPTNPAQAVVEFVRGQPTGQAVLDRLEADLLQNQVEANWRPEELAAWHLNSGYYGNQIFGLDGAARFYFGRDAFQLTLPEAAMLVGIPQNPSVNPLDNPAGAKLQQEAVLEGMLRHGLISQEQFVTARFTPLDVNLTHFQAADHVVLNRFLKQRLENRFTPEQASAEGLTVITTIDSELQAQTDCVVQAYAAYLSGQAFGGDGDCAASNRLTRSPLFPTGQFNSADSVLAMVLEPQSGKILALSGAGAIAQSPKQPGQPAGEREAGSLFYPIVYLTALSQGHNLSSMVLDIGEESDQPRGKGPIFLQEALVSGSAPAAQDVLSWIGRGSAFKTATELGARPSANADYVPGETDVELDFIEAAYAYGVLANGGIKTGIEPFGQTQQPFVIGQVENGRGDILYEASDQLGREQPILPDEVVWLVNQQLAKETLPNGQLVARVSGAGLRNQDEWTIGYGPDLLVAVWAGVAQAEGPRPAGQQPVTPALWETLMTVATEDRPVTTWPTPDNIVTLDVCWPSGLQPNGLCPTRQGLFAAGTEPILFDTMYQAFAINSENGNLATSSTPPNLVSEVTYQIFPPEAQNWATLNGFAQPPTTYDSISTETQTAGYRVEAPEPFADIQGATTITLELVELNSFDRFRVAAFQGLSPGKLQVLADDIKPLNNQRRINIPVQVPFRQNGLVTLLITGFRPDGSIDEVAIPISFNQ